jgi:hypothetical protein
MKLNYIEWYVVELGRNLTDSVPLEKQNSLLHETKTHLASLTEEFTDQGMDEKAAQLAAIDRFGTPEKIAEQFIESFRIPKSSRVSLVLNIGLFLAISIIVTCLIIQPTEFVRNGVAMTTVPIAATFGIYSLILGRRASAKWILLPTAMSFAIGVPAAFFLTSYTTGANHAQQVVSYRSLHRQYLALKTEQAEKEKFLKPYSDFYRQVLKDPKYQDGLKPGETLTVPRYHVSGGSKNIFVAFLPPQKATMWVDKDPYTMEVRPGEIVFGKDKAVAPDLMKGPMSGHNLRVAMIENLQSIKRGKNFNELVLQQLEAGLNMSIFQRIKLLAFWVGSAMLLFGIPVSWIASWIASAIRNRFRYRSRKIGLA